MIQQYSHQQLEAIDRRVREILEEQRERSANILAENRPLVEALRDLLLDKKVIDAKTLGELVKKDDSENKDSDKGDAKTMSEKEEA